MEPDVILVRHGQTEWSALGKHTGITDVPLTELGRRQGVALADMLAGMEFGAVLSSPRLRALQTMEIAGFGHLGVIVDDLQEWDYGAYEGRTTGEIRREVPDWSVWSHPIIEGESVDEVGDRADRVIERALSASGPRSSATGTCCGSWRQGGSASPPTTVDPSSCRRQPCRCLVGRGRAESSHAGTRSARCPRTTRWCDPFGPPPPLRGGGGHRRQTPTPAISPTVTGGGKDARWGPGGRSA
jgi:hypothetical protein